MAFSATDPLERLNRSFAAAHKLLERPKVARRAIVMLLAIQTGLLAYSAYVHSPTLNEPGHLVAGLSYWKFGRFDVYNVNPPLVKMIAALPVMAVGYEEDWSGFYTGLGARPEFTMGEDFVAANGERSFYLFTIARWACIPFSWLGGIVCYLWARDLFGSPSGVIACAIWCFEPNILAHASLMTPDAHAASLGLAACYTFWRWLKNPKWSQAAITGVVLGLAELAKTTFILFYPLWPMMWVIYRWRDRHSMAARDWLREVGMLAMRMAIGIYVLNLGYGIEGSLKPLREFQFVSNLLTGQANGGTDKEFAHTSSSMTSPHNRFADTWLGELPVPLPKNFLLGMDAQQRSFEDYGRPSYLRGQWRDHGWWYYYLYAATIKIPLGLLLLGGLAIAAAVVRRTRGPLSLSAGGVLRERSASVMPTSGRFGYPLSSPRDKFILLFPPLIILGVVSSKTGFSEHFRYAMPCFPFVFVWISGLFNNLIDSCDHVAACCRQLQRRSRPTFVAISFLALLLWASASSLWVFPHSISYFNEVIGGPLNGPKHLLGSNVDWGQDLRYVLWELRKRSNLERIRLGYHGGFFPGHVGLSALLPLRTKDAAPTFGDGETHPGVTHECCAISINVLLAGAFIARSGDPSQLVFVQEIANDSGRYSKVKSIAHSISIYEDRIAY